MRLSPDDIDMRAVAGVAPVAWSVVDLEGNQVLGNEAYARLFQRSMAEMQHLRVEDLTHPDDLELTKGYLDRLATGEIDQFEIDKRYVRADGSVFVGHLVVSLLRDSQGDPLALVGVIEDVTEARQLAEQVALSQDRLTKMLTNISDTVTLVDASGGVLATTGMHKEVLGRDREFWASASIFGAVHPDDAATAAALATDVLAQPGAEVSGEVRVQHAAGHWANLEVTAVNLLEDPSVGAVVVTSRNISDRKEVERELERLRDDALALAERRAGFVANVSHELRSPLHAVLGLTELLVDEVDRPEAIDLLNRVQAEAQRLLVTVDDLLDHSRVEAHGIVLEVATTDLHSLVERVCARARPAVASGADLQIVSSISPGTPRYVEADEHRLEQILTNLVGNAVKFTEAGEVAVAVRCARPGHLVFEVRDSGPGIPATHLERVFEPFAQVPGTNPGLRGAGLGLSLVRGLVELMGGHIDVECPPGGGSTFRVEIPAPTAESTDGSASPPPEAPASGCATVLVVEDTEVNQILVQGQLSRLGHLGTIVGTAGEALAILARSDHGFDLVLMDFQLPDLDGLEATRRIRRFEAPDDRHVPIVAITASAMPEDRAECLLAGMDDFLPKPVSLQALREMIDRWVPRSRRAAAGPVGSAQVAAADADAGVLDRSALDLLVTDLGDRDLVVSLVERYLAELAPRGEALRVAAEDRALEPIHRIGHTLRSTSEMLGLDELRALCAELERTSADDDLGAVLERFDAAAQRARQSLTAWIGPEERGA